MSDAATIARAQIDDLVSENERVRMERDEVGRECARLREHVRGQVEADLLLASFRIIADLLGLRQPAPQDMAQQQDQVLQLNTMRHDASMRVFAQPPGRPQGPTNLPNPFERRSNAHGTDNFNHNER